MREFMQHYGIFVALGVASVLYAWLLVAYGVACWFSRRFSHISQATLALALLTFALVLPFAPDIPFWPFLQFYCALLITPIVMIWRRWHGAVAEPGYASARELLLLHRPVVDPPSGNAGAGLFVPTNVIPDTSPRFSWRGLLGGIAILATIPAVLWLIALLDAAFSN